MEENPIFKRSPIPASASTGAISFVTGTDSPVKAASSICNELALNRRKSAGTTSPASRITISPTTISLESIALTSPPRRTFALGEDIFLRESIASSALFS